MVQPAPIPLLVIPELRKQRELARARECEAAERRRVRTTYLPLLIFAGWQALGVLVMLASASTSDQAIGQALFAGSFAVGYGGAFFHLIVYYVLGRERDEW